MAELNLKQIIDRLNAEFTGETRKLVFWYDDKAEFAVEKLSNPYDKICFDSLYAFPAPFTRKMTDTRLCPFFFA